MAIPVLFDSAEKCCACAACATACPKQAITMKKSEDGFVYPEIDSGKCIDCSLCKKVCNFQNSSLKNRVLKAYAAVSSDKDLMKRSTSGGIFASIAKGILAEGGAVYGCAYEKENGRPVPKHIRINDSSALVKLQGTKYVRSDTEGVFNKVKTDLDNGITVLFSGTPCQVDGLYGYLQNREYPNLVTVDLLCHGAPDAPLFLDHIGFIEKKNRSSVTDISFRDKAYGWGAKGSVTEQKNGKTVKRMMTPHNSAYYRLFLDAVTFRENCYQCKYASPNRVGDFTIGDYWGIAAAHPEAAERWNAQKGISCILVNTEKGASVLERFAQNLEQINSDAEKIAKKNSSLTRPCKNNQDRFTVRKLYKENGFAAVDKWWRKKQGIKRYAFLLSDKLKNR